MKDALQIVKDAFGVREQLPTTTQSERARAKAQKLIEQAERDERLAARKARIPEMQQMRSTAIEKLRAQIHDINEDQQARNALQRSIDNVKVVIESATEQYELVRAALRTAIAGGADDIIELQARVSSSLQILRGLEGTRSEFVHDLDRMGPRDEDEPTVQDLENNITAMLAMSDLAAVDLMVKIEDDKREIMAKSEHEGRWNAIRQLSPSQRWAIEHPAEAAALREQERAKEQQLVDEALRAAPWTGR